MAPVIRLALILVIIASLFPAEALAQGETTSAIVGRVWDTTNAVVPGATVTIAIPFLGSPCVERLARGVIRARRREIA